MARIRPPLKNPPPKPEVGQTWVAETPVGYVVRRRVLSVGPTRVLFLTTKKGQAIIRRATFETWNLWFVSHKPKLEEGN